MHTVGLTSFLAGTSKLPLRSRLIAYFLSLVFILFVILLVLLHVFDFLPASRAKIGESIDEYLAIYERSVSLHMGNMVASGLSLAEDMTRTLERTLVRHRAMFADVNNNPQLISRLEQASVPLLSQSLRASRSTGAFLILNATVNTSLSKAANSRCGVYLKINTPVNTNSVRPSLVWLRGMPKVADQYRLAIHNNWDLEFDITRVTPWDELLQAVDQAPGSRYFFTRAQYLRGTWEKVLLLCIPLRGRDGTVYGVCGLEISSLLFKLAHAHLSPSLPGMTGILALRQQNSEGEASLDTGAGFQDGPALAIPETFSTYAITRGKEYHEYRDGDTVFVGKEKELRLSPLPLHGEKTVWVAAVLLPQCQERGILMSRHILTASFLAIFLTLSLLLAVFLCVRYAAPVLRGIRLARNAEGEEDTTTRIQELDELIAFMKSREQELIRRQEENTGTAPESGDSTQVELGAYRLFIRQIETLTRAERLVFDLYTTGLSAHEIANKLNLSINTIRTHNRNIYAKLNVTSYKEMMVYIQMMTGKKEE